MMRLRPAPIEGAEFGMVRASSEHPVVQGLVVPLEIKAYGR